MSADGREDIRRNGNGKSKKRAKGSNESMTKAFKREATTKGKKSMEIIVFT
jgi:hypothetical protein